MIISYNIVPSFGDERYTLAEYNVILRKFHKFCVTNTVDSFAGYKTVEYESYGKKKVSKRKKLESKFTLKIPNIEIKKDERTGRPVALDPQMQDFVKLLFSDPLLIISYMGTDGKVKELVLKLTKDLCFNWMEEVYSKEGNKSAWTPKYDEHFRSFRYIVDVDRDQDISDNLLTKEQIHLMDVKHKEERKRAVIEDKRLRVYKTPAYVTFDDFIFYDIKDDRLVYDWKKKSDFRKASHNQTVTGDDLPFTTPNIIYDGRLYSIKDRIIVSSINMTTYRLFEFIVSLRKSYPQMEELMNISADPDTAYFDIETNVGEYNGEPLKYNQTEIFPAGHLVKDKEEYEEIRYNQTNDEEDDEDVDTDSFSKPENPYQPINTMSVAVYPDIYVLAVNRPLDNVDLVYVQEEIDKHNKQINGFTEKGLKYNFKYINFDTEVSLIEWFFKNIVRNKAAITGWNINGYDWAYVVNRYLKFLSHYISRCCGYNIKNCTEYFDWSYARGETNEIVPDESVRNLLIKALFVNEGVLFKEDLLDAMFTLISDYQSYYLLKNRGYGGKVTELYIPEGKIVYDYMEIYKKWYNNGQPNESLKLDFIATQTINAPKLPHTWGFDVFYRDHFPTYVAYNAIDSILVEQIDHKVRTTRIFFGLANVTWSMPREALGSVRMTERVLQFYCYDDGLVFPKRRVWKQKSNESFPGAYVYDPLPGYYRDVVSFDFASLYPTTLNQFNISPDVLIGYDKDFLDEAHAPKGAEHSSDSLVKTKGEQVYLPDQIRSLCVDEGRSGFIPKDDEIKVISGAIYLKDKKGMIPRIIADYYKKRKDAKKIMKEANHNIGLLEEVGKRRFGREVKD